MAQPKPAPGKRVISLPINPNTTVYPGDCILCASNGDGWHVVLAPHVPNVGGYPAGQSNDFVHWSVGPS